MNPHCTSSTDAARTEDVLRKGAAKLGAVAVEVVADPTQVTAATVTGPWRARSVRPVERRFHGRDSHQVPAGRSLEPPEIYL